MPIPCGCHMCRPCSHWGVVCTPGILERPQGAPAAMAAHERGRNCRGFVPPRTPPARETTTVPVSECVGAQHYVAAPQQRCWSPTVLRNYLGDQSVGTHSICGNAAVFDTVDSSWRSLGARAFRDALHVCGAPNRCDFVGCRTEVQRPGPGSWVGCDDSGAPSNGFVNMASHSRACAVHGCLL